MTTSQDDLSHVNTGEGNSTIAVHRYPGTGPEVLLIHGISSSSADFNPVIAAMSDFCQPITMDLRGHGASGKPASGYHYSDYIRDLDAVLDHLNMEHPIIVGHSLGGIVTLTWAAQNPGKARALIIEDSPLRSGEDFREAFEGWLQLNALTHETAKAWYAEKNPHWPESTLERRSFDMVNTSRAAILELQQASLSNEGLDSVDGIAAITSPLLFLQGDPKTGSMVHPDDLAALQQSLPQMQIQMFENAGHTIHRSHPDEWLTTVKSFLSELKN